MLVRQSLKRHLSNGTLNVRMKLIVIVKQDKSAFSYRWQPCLVVPLRGFVIVFSIYKQNAHAAVRKRAG